MKRLCAILLAMVMFLSGQAALVTAAEATPAAADAGLTGDEIARLQARLIELAFLEGGADGNYGKTTQAALCAFQSFAAQQGRDVPVDGVAGPETMALLFEDEELFEARLSVKKGDKGGAVQLVQAGLNKLGYLFTNPSGVFDEKTLSALEAFQGELAAQGAPDVSVTGIADAATRALLYGDLSAYNLVTPVFFDDANPLSMQDAHLFSRACIVIDAKTGEALYEKNANERMYPASTTKIMTLLLAVNNGKLKKKVKVPKSANQVPGDSSLVPVTPGELMPFQDLLYGLMIRSGNDAANAIATLTAGSVDKFVQKMNKRAQALGLEGTHYTNPHGYHSKDHYTTAADMAKLTRQALTNEKFKKIVSTKSYTMSPTKKRKALTLTNTYDILDIQSRYYYPGAFGIKTGYTSASGQCYVGAATRNGRTLISVVFDCGGNKTHKWIDTARLFNYGFAK